MWEKIKNWAQTGIFWVFGAFLIAATLAWDLFTRLTAAKGEVRALKEDKVTQEDTRKVEEADHAAKDAVSNYESIAKQYRGGSSDDSGTSH